MTLILSEMCFELFIYLFFTHNWCHTDFLQQVCCCCMHQYHVNIPHMLWHHARHMTPELYYVFPQRYITIKIKTTHYFVISHIKSFYRVAYPGVSTRAGQIPEMPGRYTSPGTSITLWEMSGCVNGRSLAASLCRSASILQVSSSNYIFTAGLNSLNLPPVLHTTCWVIASDGDFQIALDGRKSETLTVYSLKLDPWTGKTNF